MEVGALVKELSDSRYSRIKSLMFTRQGIFYKIINIIVFIKYE